MNKLAPLIAPGLTVAVALCFATACSSSDDDTSKNPGTGGTNAGAGKGGTGTGGAGKAGAGTGGSNAGAGGSGGSSAGAGGTSGRGGTGAGGVSAAGTGGVSAGAGGMPCPSAGTGAGGSPAGGSGAMSGSAGIGGASAGNGGGGVGGASLGGAGSGGANGGGRSGGGRGPGGRGAAGMSGGMSGGSSGGAGGMSGGGGMAGAPSCADIPPLAMGDASFTISSPDFASCMPIPAVSTCDAKPFPQGTSPALTWTAGPAGTLSYAVVLKDLAVLARTDPTDPNYNRGYHYVMWDIPTTVLTLPRAMLGGFASTDVPGAAQWSNFNDYGFFGPCPNFDPTMPTNYDDVYAFEVYALPTAKADVPAPVAGMSTVRQLDDSFKAVALAVAEYRGTSSAHSSGVPCGVLPPMTHPPCPSTGTPPDGCLAVP